MLLDGLNTKFEDQTYARQQLIKMLGQLQPDDRVALYTLGRELKIIHDFTTDASSILRVLGKVTAAFRSDRFRHRGRRMPRHCF